MPPAIDAIADANMDSQFDDTVADGLRVTEIARFDLAQTDTNACGGDFVADA